MTMHDRVHPAENDPLVQASKDLRIASERLASFSEGLRIEAQHLREHAKDTYIATARIFDGE